MTDNIKLDEPNRNTQHFEAATNTSKRINWVVYFILLFLAAVVALFLYWTFQGSNVLDVKNNPVPVRTIRPHPQADGVVFLNINYCKNTKAEGRVRTSFVSPTREYFFPVSIDRQDPNCKFQEVPVAIPHEVLPGEYHIHFRITYKVNPIKTVVEEFDSKKFEVVPREN
jgi:hypothetical protein